MLFNAIRPKLFLSSLISISLATSPLAYAKESSELQIKIGNYLRNTTSDKNQTIGEWYQMASKYMHKDLEIRLRPWATEHAQEKMPKIEVVSTNEGQKERVRMIITETSGKLTTLDFTTENDKAMITFEGKKYSYEDIYYGTTEDTSSQPIIQFMSYQELKKMQKINPQLAANYLARVRGVVNALERLQGYFVQAPIAIDDLPAPTSKEKTSYLDLILETAYAKKPSTRSQDGMDCIVGGHVSKINNFSCGSRDEKVTEGCDKKNQIRCNELVYGKKDKNPICVSKVPASQVSVECNNVNPLPENAQKILEDNDIKDDFDDYFNKLTSQITHASAACGLKNADVATMFKNASEKASKAPNTAGNDKVFTENDFSQHFKGDKNKHHRLACATILNRIFWVNKQTACNDCNLAVAAAANAAATDPGTQSPTDNEKKEDGKKMPDDEGFVAMSPEGNVGSNQICNKPKDNQPAWCPVPTPAPTAVAPPTEPKPQALPPAALTVQPPQDTGNLAEVPRDREPDKKREKKEGGMCFGLSSFWPCAIGIGAAACLLWLCKKKKETKTTYVPMIPPLPGKSGETQNTSTTTTRPNSVR